MLPLVGNRVKTRFQVLDCNVRLQSKGISGLFGKQTYWGSLIDLSPSGIQIVTNDMLESKKQYDIVFDAPVFRRPISTKGRIKWQKPYEGKDAKQYYQIGFEFTYFKGRAMEQLEELAVNPHLRAIKKN